MDFGAILFDVVLFAAIFGLLFRKQLRAWLSSRLKRTAKQDGPAIVAVPDQVDQATLTTRLDALDKAFSDYGNEAAHPSALYAHPRFMEAVSLLASPGVSLAVVLQYVEGNRWGLASAALVALRSRPDRKDALSRVLNHCEHCYPWPMFFALELLFEADPAMPVGVPLLRGKEWWVDSRWMPNIFREYFDRCAARGDAPTFGAALKRNASLHQIIRRFLEHIDHPTSVALTKELDEQRPAATQETAAKSDNVLNAVGRFWREPSAHTLVKPDAWRQAFERAAATLQQNPPRSLLVCGEPLVGKTAFLELLADAAGKDGWSVFEASGVDLQADQIYIGQLEGRIRQVVEELAKGRKFIWYIPDIVQLALSGRHLGQTATMLDQIVPAVAAGRLVVWCEATPKGAARLAQVKPSLRGLFETVTIEPLSPAETLTLTRAVIEQIAEGSSSHFHPDCAQVALDTASQYLGTSGLPGSALSLLKLSAARVATGDESEIAPRRVLETLSQLSGLPVSILDTREQLDLASLRQFFTMRVLGQSEAVEAVAQRIAMLKAGLNDPGKPIGVFLFAGPTGTGKTELAKAIAEFLFGSVERMIRLDMSEFQTHESLSKILGQSQASAIETESLIGRVRKQPFSVLLLDEFEKSHPMVWDLFLQAFDEGRLTDAMGQVADLRHCLIVLTSNLGATAHRSLGLGFVPQADEFSKDQVLRAISQTYRPEFQNRLDKVIVFRPLTRDLMRGILKKELNELLNRRGLKDRAWAIEWEASALEFLLEKGFSPEMGARPLKRAIDQYLVAPLAAMIVEKRFPEGEQFLFVRSDGEGIQVEFVDPDADVTPAAPATGGAPSLAASPSLLAAIVLAPEGSPREFQVLQTEFAHIEATLRSAEWDELKGRLAADMSAVDFWSRPDRFATLARFALMDRVKAAAETAAALRLRLERYSRSPRPYSAELTGRLALQLYLVREGIKDGFENAPVELALLIEPVFDGAGDRRATQQWCGKLLAMYRAWAGKRRMHVSEVAAGGKESADTPILVIGGFGAHRVLASEVGLHVFESSEGAAGRVTARVRVAVVPLGEIAAAKERKLIVKALDDAPRANAVVRRYREEPPLVRDTAGKWRSGRLDLVLGGEFDLLQAGER